SPRSWATVRWTRTHSGRGSLELIGRQGRRRPAPARDGRQLAERNRDRQLLRLLEPPPARRRSRSAATRLPGGHGTRPTRRASACPPRTSTPLPSASSPFFGIGNPRVILSPSPHGASGDRFARRRDAPGVGGICCIAHRTDTVARGLATRKRSAGRRLTSAR